MKILFVCMGNICRSPTAEGVFRDRAVAAGVQVETDSAGTHAYHIGEPPDRRSIRHAAARGVDIGMLRARQVEASDFERFDYVLAMDHENMARLQAACPPALRHKLHLFMSFSDGHASAVVPDPYYGGANGFDLVLDYCEAASDGLLRHLERS